MVVFPFCVIGARPWAPASEGGPRRRGGNPRTRTGMSAFNRRLGRTCGRGREEGAPPGAADGERMRRRRSLRCRRRIVASGERRGPRSPRRDGASGSLAGREGRAGTRCAGRGRAVSTGQRGPCDVMGKKLEAGGPPRRVRFRGRTGPAAGKGDGAHRDGGANECPISGLCGCQATGQGQTSPTLTKSRKGRGMSAGRSPDIGKEWRVSVPGPLPVGTLREGEGGGTPVQQPQRSRGRTGVKPRPVTAVAGCGAASRRLAALMRGWTARGKRGETQSCFGGCRSKKKEGLVPLLAVQITIPIQHKAFWWDVPSLCICQAVDDSVHYLDDIIFCRFYRVGEIDVGKASQTIPQRRVESDSFY